MSFEKYWQDKKAYDEKKQATTTMVVPQPSNAPMFNHAILFKTIDDRDSMTDAELRYFIHNNFQVIMNNVFAQPVAEKYLNAFKEPRFLEAFTEVVTRIQYLEPDMIVRINLIIYDYITFIDNQHDILDQMKRLASVVNYSKSIILKKYNLQGNMDIYLLVARYSNFDLRVCVRRVNLMIIRSQKLMNQLKIDPSSEASLESVDFLAKLIYDLFDASTWNTVLSHFMLDVLPASDDSNPALQWITPYVEAMDSAVSLAILHLLDTLIPTSKMLIDILRAYTEGNNLIYGKYKKRFSFQSISEDYPRLLSALAYLSKEEDTIVP